MIANLLAKLFIKNYQLVENPKVRESYARMANIFFMVVMGSMGVVKYLIGSSVGSIAISSSAFADFSDIGLAAMMMISFKLAGKKPDVKHPFGYARIEYISGIIVSMIILLLGIELLQSSIEKIVAPEPPEVSTAAYIIMAVSVVVNLTVFSVNKTVSKKIRSSSIGAAATKNIVDGLASLVILGSLVVFAIFSVDLDGYVGLLMSITVLYSAVTSFKETANPLLGLVPDLAFTEEIRKRVLSYPYVIGTHNEIVHNYGNNHCYVSLHAEFSEELSAVEIHQIIGDIEQDFLFDGIQINIHFDLVAKEDKLTMEIEKHLLEICEKLKYKVSLSDLKIMPSNAVTYLFFTATVPRDLNIGIDEMRHEFSTRISEYDSSYKAAITVSYSHV
ncbi:MULTISPECIES: cation diffusion facilitator family transporter [unclassified Fusibacter]|uniref:cation diffusion facilitator family transporter n=1 Tax=unclassified Fusibacter TaxID=2624464 RepID=UPI0013E96398|nr:MULTISPECIES: cation diffusion facilitator family transporter [unclassified Fusibacter]MCK8058470.1 cation diffusion facilitator family transporter [Fusibacter sp. A2]NPE22762.1 cation transporter [Fusibacter sp. A1]